MTKDTVIGQGTMTLPLEWGPNFQTSGWGPGPVFRVQGPQGMLQGPIPQPTLKEGAKLDAGKVGVHLLPPDPLIEISKVLDYGAIKYAPYNWAKGIKYSRVYGALLRHLWAWWKGESGDSETGLSHLAHAGCCLLFLMQYEINRKEFDDRPVKEYATDGEIISARTTTTP